MKVAVVLFNLGGPDRPEAIRPFLVNLFGDPAIIRAPGPLRWVLARLIARRREATAREIYARIGGRSPILENTRAQAAALEAALRPALDARVFVAMRYWHPRAAATLREVAAFAPERVVLLPLYPQYSTATTASSLAEWRACVRAAGLDATLGDAAAVCCYPVEDGFVDALAELTRGAAVLAQRDAPVRVLYSAHGLPQRVVDRGDPYQAQVEATAAAVSERLGLPGIERVVCYQSRVGPLEWLRPYTEDELRRAGRDQRAVVLVPVSFVSEHSETLVELDVAYRELALAAGVPHYERVPAVAVHAAFVAGLARSVRMALARAPAICPPGGTRWCPARHSGCPVAPSLGQA